jgi:hypothetical protein
VPTAKYLNTDGGVAVLSATPNARATTVVTVVAAVTVVLARSGIAEVYRGETAVGADPSKV